MTFKTIAEIASAFASVAFHLFGEIVGPSGCAACDTRVGSTHLFCPTCAASVERADETGEARRREPLEYAAFEYGGALATAIARFKYRQRPDLGPRLGRVMTTAADRLRGRVDVVVPVPLHPKRLAERGYNQAALLARPVAEALKVELVPRALRRRVDTPRQAELDRAERFANMQNAFMVRDRAVAARILLVDDVRTTGATLDACAAALHSAGARQVFALVLARASTLRRSRTNDLSKCGEPPAPRNAQSWSVRPP